MHKKIHKNFESYILFWFFFSKKSNIYGGKLSYTSSNFQRENFPRAFHNVNQASNAIFRTGNFFFRIYLFKTASEFYNTSFTYYTPRDVAFSETNILHAILNNPETCGATEKNKRNRNEKIFMLFSWAGKRESIRVFSFFFSHCSTGRQSPEKNSNNSAEKFFTNGVAECWRDHFSNLSNWKWTPIFVGFGIRAVESFWRLGAFWEVIFDSVFVRLFWFHGMLWLKLMLFAWKYWNGVVFN